LSLDEQITVSESAAGMGGSQMFLEAGDTYTVDDLMKGIVVVSANDASVQIAERLAGSEEEFVNMMNERAKQLNMKNTHFNNCTGLPAPENYSSAEDVAIMTLELIKHKDYYKYSTIWIENFNHPDGRVTEFVNTNKLVRFYKGCDGGKTGYTSESLFCLSASAERNGMRVVSIIIGAPSSKIRFAECSRLLNTAFAQYKNEMVVDKDNFGVNEINVVCGKSDCAKVALDRSVYALVKKGDSVKYETTIEMSKSVKAPLKAGDKVGTLYVLDKGVVIEKRDIIVTENIDKASYGDYLRKIFTQW
jgi:D-alanyl-D-alanine carboxypeptidase (penicillin-binding protein 5/6)